jgi:hypothetical protein
MEVIERIDAEIILSTTSIRDAEAQLQEWTAGVNPNAAINFYAGIVDVVQGRIARASGIKEVNAALHDVLTGVWLSYDGQVLTADVTFRATGDDFWDECLCEMFSGLEPRPGMVENQREALAVQLPDSPPICAGSTTPANASTTMRSSSSPH